jgi:hypothetical protein
LFTHDRKMLLSLVPVVLLTTLVDGM